MDKYIYIVGDTNDADYVTTFTKITDKALASIAPMIEAIKNFKPYKVKLPDKMEWQHSHNFPNSEYTRTDLGEKTVKQLYVDTGLVSKSTLKLFSEYVPRGEYGIHSIKHIEIYLVEAVKKLL